MKIRCEHCQCVQLIKVEIEDTVVMLACGHIVQWDEDSKTWT